MEILEYTRGEPIIAILTQPEKIKASARIILQYATFSHKRVFILNHKNLTATNISNYQEKMTMGNNPQVTMKQLVYKYTLAYFSAGHQTDRESYTHKVCSPHEFG